MHTEHINIFLVSFESLMQFAYKVFSYYYFFLVLVDKKKGTAKFVYQISLILVFNIRF